MARHDHPTEDVPPETAPPGHDPALERERFGGMKIGSTFFGWLTAMGMAVLLTALLAAAGTAVGLSADDATVGQASTDVGGDPQTVGIIGLIVLAVIVFVAYYSGGYVAGRMARFDGVRQGLGVWLWAIVVAIVLAVLGLIAGDRYNVLGQLNGFPRLPVGEGDLTTAGIITAVVVVVTSLVGALLGGKAGMHFHRKVDRTGIEDRVV